jgi:hypothetical protein
LLLAQKVSIIATKIYALPFPLATACTCLDTGFTQQRLPSRFLLQTSFPSNFFSHEKDHAFYTPDPSLCGTDGISCL